MTSLFTATLKCTFICVLFVLPQNRVNSQNKLITGEASALMNDHQMTRPMYEAMAYQMAVNKALDNAFGSSVQNIYERYTYTEMQGRSVAEYKDVRNNFLNTYPNGIWIKDNTVEYNEEKDSNGLWWMVCTVVGEAKEINNAHVGFDARLLDGLDVNRNQSVEFSNGEQGYLFFKSPENGYLICFYDDMQTVQRCLPYNSSNSLQLKVENNRDYIFYSATHANYGVQPSSVDEIEFYAEKQLEYNQLYILFSPHAMGSYFINSAKELEDGYSTFKSMSRQSFHEWLQENRLRNPELQVEIIGVTIKN